MASPPTEPDPSTGPAVPADALEMTPAQAYSTGYEFGRVTAVLDSINRRLDEHLIRVGFTPEDIAAATQAAAARKDT